LSLFSDYKNRASAIKRDWKTFSDLWNLPIYEIWPSRRKRPFAI